MMNKKYKYKDIRRFDENQIKIIFDFFSDVHITDGYDVEIKYRVKRNRNGDFKGVCLKNWSWPNQSNSKQKIINEMSFKTKLNEETIIKEYSHFIEKKFYDLPIATYLLCNDGTTDDNIFHNNIYNCDLFSTCPYVLVPENSNTTSYFKDIIDLENKVISLKLSGVDEVIFDNSKKIPSILHDEYGQLSRFYNDDRFNKNIYFIYNSDTPMTSPITDNHDIFKKIIDLVKINLNIIDHLGKIHKYVTYHKIV